MSAQQTPTPVSRAITPRCLVPKLMFPCAIRGYRCGRLTKPWLNYREASLAVVGSQP